jgi:hypothetical protein
MKVVNSEQLCQYPEGTIFRQIYPAKHGKNFNEPQSFSEYHVILDKGDREGIWLVGDLFDWENSGRAEAPDLKLGDEFPITNDNHSSAAGCYGKHWPEDLYQVFDAEDLRRAFGRLLIPGHPLTFEQSYRQGEAR